MFESLLQIFQKNYVSRNQLTGSAVEHADTFLHELHISFVLEKFFKEFFYLFDKKC